MVTAGPPDPFNAVPVTVNAGQTLYRVHDLKYASHAFNPGKPPAVPTTRFAFFGNPPVPVLYAAATVQAAIAETLLHDMPAEGGNLLPHTYRTKQLSEITTTEDLRVASLKGLDLRVLKAAPADVTNTDAADYPQTVLWAEAAYNAGFDGVTYMSRMCNTDIAYAFFDTDRTRNAFQPDPAPLRSFALPADRDWLDAFCSPLHVTVIA